MYGRSHGCKRTGVVLLLLVGAAFTGACSGNAEDAEPIRPVRVLQVGEGEAIVGRNFPGRAKATQEVNLSFRVPGTVSVIPVRLGEVVEEGQIVARLDSRDFEVRVRTAEANLRRAQADLALAQEEHRRTQDAYERQGASELEVTRARERANALAANVESLDAALDAARHDLEDAVLTSPFAGVVTARYVDTFQDVQAKQPILRILDNSSVEFVISVPEHLMALGPIIDAIRCEFDAYPGLELPASVKEAGAEADPTTRTYPVTLIMAQPEDVQILPGMTGTAWVTGVRPVDNGDFGFDVPLSAVGESPDGTQFVWVLDESKRRVSRRTVTTSAVSPTGVRVTGVQQGELVVTAGAAFLRENQHVRILHDDATGNGSS